MSLGFQKLMKISRKINNLTLIVLFLLHHINQANVSTKPTSLSGTHYVTLMSHSWTELAAVNGRVIRIKQLEIM